MRQRASSRGYRRSRAPLLRSRPGQGLSSPPPIIGSCCPRGHPDTPTRVGASPACVLPSPAPPASRWGGSDPQRRAARRGMLCRRSQPGSPRSRKLGSVCLSPRLSARRGPRSSPLSCPNRAAVPAVGWPARSEAAGLGLGSMCGWSREKGSESVCLGSPGSLGTGLGGPGTGMPVTAGSCQEPSGAGRGLPVGAGVSQWVTR